MHFEVPTYSYSPLTNSYVSRKPVSTSPGAMLLHLLAELPPSKRQSFYNLSYVNLLAGLEPDSPEYNEELALAIFQTNSIAAGSNVGIFPKVARLNHGCSSAFNSVYTWREAEGALVVYALKSIKRGQVCIFALVNRSQHGADPRGLFSPCRNS